MHRWPDWLVIVFLAAVAVAGGGSFAFILNAIGHYFLARCTF